MKHANCIKVKMSAILALLLMVSCTPVRFTYTAENVKGNAEMNKERMIADYGQFAIQYTSEGGVTIINKSDSTMYIDMGESFYIYDGVAQQIYSNSSTTDFSSETRGLQMGGATKVTGIGGAPAVAGGSWGRSNTSGSSRTSIEERYVSIPPMSRVQMKSFLFEPVNSMEWGKTKDQPWREARRNKLVKEGTYHYDRYSSPTHEYVFAYTFNPADDFKSTRDLFYVTDIEIDHSLKKVPEKANQITKEGKTIKDRLKLVGGILGTAVLYAGIALIGIFSAN